MGGGFFERSEHTTLYSKDDFQSGKTMVNLRPVKDADVKTKKKNKDKE